MKPTLRLTYGFLLVVFCFALSVPQTALACTGSCSSDSDCSANPCRYCDTDFGRCADCCEFTDALDCPPACTWDAGSLECRNISSLSCAIVIPESPKPYRNYFFYIALAALVVIAGFGGYRLYRRRQQKMT